MKMGTPTDEPGLFEVPGGFAIQVKVKLGSVTKWKRKSLPGATRAEALLELKKLRAEAWEVARAKENKEDPHRALAVFARRWDDDLKRRVDEGAITPATRSAHVHNLDKFVLPFIGTMMVDEIKPKTIVDWMRWIPQLHMEETRIGRGTKSYAQEPKHYAKPTLQSAWRTLRTFMKWLTIETDLPRNPAAEVRWSMKGAAPSNTKATLNQAEVLKLLEAADAEEGPQRPPDDHDRARGRSARERAQRSARRLRRRDDRDRSLSRAREVRRAEDRRESPHCDVAGGARGGAATLQGLAAATCRWKTSAVRIQGSAR
jgi:hypothetical protein